jgi:hypothetical protein
MGYASFMAKAHAFYYVPKYMLILWSMFNSGNRNTGHFLIPHGLPIAN